MLEALLAFHIFIAGCEFFGCPSRRRCWTAVEEEGMRAKPLIS